MEGQAKVEEYGRGYEASGDIAPVHCLIEGVELAGVMEAPGREGSETEQEKVQRFSRARAPVVDEKAGRKIKEANPKFVIESGISSRSLNKDVVLFKIDPIPA